MKVRKSLFDNEFISLISFFLFLFLSFPYVLKATDPDQVEASADGEPVTVTLRHVLHHGSTKFPKLLRRIDLIDSKVNAYELASGMPLTYTLMGTNGTGIKYEKENAVKEFRETSKNKFMTIMLDWRDIKKYLPKWNHWGTLINLAKLTYNAYVKPTDEDWYDVGEKYGVNSSFGWEHDGIRGYVFASQDNKTLVISIKGTSMGFNAGPTVPKDKYNDNRLFSCCCAYVDRTWSPVCPCYLKDYDCNLNCLQSSVDEDDLYYTITLSMVDRIMDEFPNSHIWLTGHSLGGALSSLVGLTFNLPVIAYESPGDRMAARRLHLPRPPAVPSDQMNIWHFGHTADPIFMGVCNGFRSFCYLGGYALESKCHVGTKCSFDSVDKLGWNVDIRTHSIKHVIDKILSVWWELFKNFPICKDDDECEDCYLWNYIDGL